MIFGFSFPSFLLKSSASRLLEQSGQLARVLATNLHLWKINILWKLVGALKPLEKLVEGKKHEMNWGVPKGGGGGGWVGGVGGSH